MRLLCCFIILWCHKGFQFFVELKTRARMARTEEWQRKLPMIPLK